MSDEGDDLTDLPVASHIELENCPPECCCQRVHVLFCDAEGDPFAAAALTPEHARALARVVGKKADIAEAQQLRAERRLA